jgi:hypothetical protein
MTQAVCQVLICEVLIYMHLLRCCCCRVMQIIRNIAQDLAPQNWFASQSHSVLHSTQIPFLVDAPGFAPAASFKPIVACRLFMVGVVSTKYTLQMPVCSSRAEHPASDAYRALSSARTRANTAKMHGVVGCPHTRMRAGLHNAGSS